MPIAKKAIENCPSCDYANNVWMFEKEEGTVTKECYTCESCGCEWTEIKED